jgi:uroporphyrinogen-III synthase
MKLLVTRPAAQASGWVQALSERGLDAAALPLIGIAAAADAAAVAAAWSGLGAQRLVVFVSPNAVEHFFALRPAGMPWPASTLAGSTGPGTSQALRQWGVSATQIAEPRADAPQFDSEALWQQLAPQDWHDAGVLIVRGDGGRDWLSDTLRSHGARVTHLAAYRRVAPAFTAAERVLLGEALAAPGAHVWLFSSSEAVGLLQTQLAPGASWASARAIATHPRIAESARAAGFGQVILARPELDAVVACLQSLPPPAAS